MIVRVQRHGARALSLIVDVLHQINDAQVAMVRALGEQARQLLRVARLAHLVVEHEQVGLVWADRVVEALAPAMHELDVRVKRAKRLIALLPLAVHPDQARRERLDQSIFEHLSHKARFPTASWPR